MQDASTRQGRANSLGNEKVPGGQATQLVAPGVPKGMGKSVPGSTSAYCPATQYEQRKLPAVGAAEPLGQVLHSASPAYEKLPGMQGSQALAPGVLWKNPPGQGLHFPASRSA